MKTKKEYTNHMKKWTDNREDFGGYIPECVIDQLSSYLADGERPTGGFLLAVLSNDLMKAAYKANSECSKNLSAIVQYLYAYAPKDKAISATACRHCGRDNEYAMQFTCLKCGENIFKGDEK